MCNGRRAEWTQFGLHPHYANLKKYICTSGVYATCFSPIGPSSCNTSFKGVYCTVHWVKEYALRHVVVVIINFLEF
jgi:hypothetical protein